MDDFVKRVIAYCEEKGLLHNGERIVVGLSGGPDSVALLLVLLAAGEMYALDIQAVHIHHGLRDSADKDEQFVQALCREKNVSLTVFHEDVKAVASKRGLTLEEAGREVRYARFAQLSGDRIAVAHHMDDQAETVLFRLFRGTGPLGIRGMLPDTGKVIRPFLCVTKEDILSFLERNGQAFCVDETNTDASYSRNLIREKIMPAAKQLYPNATEHIAGAAELLLKEQQFLQKTIREAYARCKVEEKGRLPFLDLQRFDREDVYLQRGILLVLLEEMSGNHRKDLTKEHVELLLAMVKKGEGRMDLPYGLVASCVFERLYIYREDVLKKRKEKCPFVVKSRVFAVEEPWTVMQKQIPRNKYTKWFDYATMKNGLQARLLRDEDVLFFDRQGHKKPVKELLMEEKMPSFEREAAFLVADDEAVLWIPGGRCNMTRLVTEQTSEILEIQIDYL